MDDPREKIKSNFFNAIYIQTTLSLSGGRKRSRRRSRKSLKHSLFGGRFISLSGGKRRSTRRSRRSRRRTRKHWDKRSSYRRRCFTHTMTRIDLHTVPLRFFKGSSPLLTVLTLCGPTRGAGWTNCWSLSSLLIQIVSFKIHTKRIYPTTPWGRKGKHASTVSGESSLRIMNVTICFALEPVMLPNGNGNGNEHLKLIQDCFPVSCRSKLSLSASRQQTFEIAANYWNEWGNSAWTQ